MEELQTLAMQAGGRNLTDHYWFHRTDKNFVWKDVNYFENPFDTVKEKGATSGIYEPGLVTSVIIPSIHPPLWQEPLCENIRIIAPLAQAGSLKE